MVTTAEPNAEFKAACQKQIDDGHDPVARINDMIPEGYVAICATDPPLPGTSFWSFEVKNEKGEQAHLYLTTQKKKKQRRS